jgi:hypothetical protein
MVKEGMQLVAHSVTAVAAEGVAGAAALVAMMQVCRRRKPCNPGDAGVYHST